MNTIKSFCLLMIVLLSACSQVSVPKSQAWIQPTQAERIFIESYDKPPNNIANWQKIQLPDNWDITHSNQGGGAWYRIPVSIDKSDTIMAIMLENFSMNALIFWDTFQIASGGQMSEPIARNWHNPIFTLIPSNQSNVGQHWLHIYIRGYSNDAAGLGLVIIAPEKDLLPYYKKVKFIKQTLGLISLFVTLMIALCSFMLWLLYSKQAAVLWLGISSIFLAFAISNYVIQSPPMSRFYWCFICQISIDMYALTLMMMVHRFLHIQRAILEKILASIFLIGGSIIFIIQNTDGLMGQFLILHTIAMLSGVYTFTVSIWQWFKTKTLDAFIVSIALLVILLVGAHDWWAVYIANQLQYQLMMQFGPTVSLLIISIWMIIRWVSAMRISEQYTKQMEQEIIRITNTLQQEQQQLIRLEQEKTIARERTHFTRELHDGLGGHLVALSTMLKNNTEDKNSLIETVDQALLDMRIIMDGTGEQCHDVGMILGMLRFRLTPRMENIGIKCDWVMDKLPMQCTLQYGESLHLLRIIQEALTNIAKHSGANKTSITAIVNTEAKQDYCRIEIKDNGHGWDVEKEYGHGLKNMHERAEILHAKLQILSNKHGTSIILLIPVYLK